MIRHDRKTKLLQELRKNASTFFLYPTGWDPDQWKDG